MRSLLLVVRHCSSRISAVINQQDKLKACDMRSRRISSLKGGSLRRQALARLIIKLQFSSS